MPNLRIHYQIGLLGKAKVVVSVAVSSQRLFRIVGRSFFAFVLTPELPVAPTASPFHRRQSSPIWRLKPGGPIKANLRTGFPALAIMLAVAVPANGGQIEDGVAAYQRGDYAAAVRLWRPLAEQGLAGAQYNLGIMYSIGHGLRRDYGEAVKWLRKAAEQGEVQAQHNLGNMYRLGRGVSEDYTEAVKWYGRLEVLVPA